jgi:hypothetical protein
VASPFPVSGILSRGVDPAYTGNNMEIIQQIGVELVPIRIAETLAGMQKDLLKSQSMISRLQKEAERNLKVTQKAMAKGLSPSVDHRALTALNKHLELKQKHWKEVNQDFNKSLSPKVNLGGLTDLNAALAQINKYESQEYKFTLGGGAIKDGKLKLDTNNISAGVSIGIRTGLGTMKVSVNDNFRVKASIDTKIFGGLRADLSRVMDTQRGTTAAVDRTKSLGTILKQSLFGSLFSGIANAVNLKGAGQFAGNVIGKPLANTAQSYVKGVTKDYFGMDSTQDLETELQRKVSTYTNAFNYDNVIKEIGKAQDAMADELQPVIFGTGSESLVAAKKIDVLKAALKGLGKYAVESSAPARTIKRGVAIKDLLSSEKGFENIEPTAIRRHAGNIKNQLKKGETPTDTPEVYATELNLLREKQGLKPLQKDTLEFAEELKKNAAKVSKSIFEGISEFQEAFAVDDLLKSYQLLARPVRKAGFQAAAEQSARYADEYTKFIAALDESAKKTMLVHGNGQSVKQWTKVVGTAFPETEVVSPIDPGIVYGGNGLGPSAKPNLNSFEG